jgi:hypothetical protein
VTIAAAKSLEEPPPPGDRVVQLQIGDAFKRTLSAKADSDSAKCSSGQEYPVAVRPSALLKGKPIVRHKNVDGPHKLKVSDVREE